MIEKVRQSVIEALHVVLRPFVRLLIRNNIGYAEFSNVAKSVFVDVASVEYGIRGRPTNVSKLSTILGLSRREIRRIQVRGPTTEWDPSMEQSPVNTIMHFWRYDKDYSFEPGIPLVLSPEGETGFSSLVKKYASDVPAGAIKNTLLSRGLVIEHSDKSLELVGNFTIEKVDYIDLLNTIFFSLHNFLDTIDINSRTAFEVQKNVAQIRHFERTVWTDRLDREYSEEFKDYVSSEGQLFLERVDEWIGLHEKQATTVADSTDEPITGIGLYYFEREKKQGEPPSKPAQF